MTAEQLQRIKTFESSRKVCFDDEWYEAEREECKRELAKKNGSQAPEKFCDCRELVIDGERQPCPPRHDCAYVRARSELVPIAAREASASVPDDPANGNRWTKLFVEIMERLVSERLQSGNGAHEITSVSAAIRSHPPCCIEAAEAKAAILAMFK